MSMDLCDRHRGAVHRAARGAERVRFPWTPALLCSLVCLAAAGGLRAAEFHVAPDGSDAGPGTQDRPFATLERPRDAIRLRRAAGAVGEPVTIHVRGGVYPLAGTLTLDERDSGSEVGPVVWRSAPGEQPVLLGGRPIRDFSAGDRGILKADLRTAGLEGIRFRVLVFDGRRQEPARHPNRDPRDVNNGAWAFVDGVRYDMYSDSPDEDGYHAGHRHLDYWQRNIPRLTRTLRVRPEDMLSLSRPEEAEVSIFPRFNWWHYVLPVESCDAGQRVLHLGPGSFYEIRPGDRYFIRNVREALDAPGEWYLDDRAWTLEFLPPRPLAGRPVYAAALMTVLDLKGCRQVAFEGFTIECCNGTAVRLTDCAGCAIRRCTIRNAGDREGHGVQIAGGSGNRLLGNDIYGIGACGVMVSGGDPVAGEPGGHVVENNYIHHVGLVGRHAKGVELAGCGHRAACNLIHDVPQSGLWIWGNRHVIEFNRIRHTCLEGEDTGAVGGGAIDWVSWLGVVIRGNFIHDTIGFGYDRRAGKWRSPYFTYAVYPDWAASGVQITGNILARAGTGLLNMHSGRDNLIENNVFVDGRESQVDFNGWTTATGFWSTKVREWTAMYDRAAAHAAWRDVPALRDPRLVPLPDGRVMYGNVLRRNIFAYRGAAAAMARLHDVPLDRNVWDFNVVHACGGPVRTGLCLVLSERGENLLPDPGLEDAPVGSFPADWGVAPGDGTRARVVEGDAHAGQRALLVEPAAPAEGDSIVRPLHLSLGSVPFRPGGAYSLAVWMRGTGGPVGVDLAAFSWKQNVHNWSEQTRFLLDDRWQRCQLAFRLPAEGQQDYAPTMDRLHWRLTFPTGAPAFLVDDASLREAELSDEWTAWQARGMDRHSVVADPLFADPDHDDYRLRDGSPALPLGFKTIPVERIGPYADENRASWPITEEPGAREAAQGG